MQFATLVALAVAAATATASPVKPGAGSVGKRQLVVPFLHSSAPPKRPDDEPTDIATDIANATNIDDGIDAGVNADIDADCTDIDIDTDSADIDFGADWEKPKLADLDVPHPCYLECYTTNVFPDEDENEQFCHAACFETVQESVKNWPCAADCLANGDTYEICQDQCPDEDFVDTW
ncbi:hypothetical protein PG990_002333 [Apiospora arundinis]